MDINQGAIGHNNKQSITIHWGHRHVKDGDFPANEYFFRLKKSHPTDFYRIAYFEDETVDWRQHQIEVAKYLSLDPRWILFQRLGH